MKLHRADIAVAAFPVIAAALSAGLYGSMPGSIPTHWNAAGEADGYMSRELGLLVMPLVMAGVALLFLAIPRLDPMRRNIESFRGRYDLFCVAMMAFFLALHAMMLLWGLGYELSMNIFISIGFSVVMAAAGYMMRAAKRNYMIGIRTPWTLASDEVWERTHRLGGTLFMASGAFALLGVFLGKYAVFAIMAPVLISSVVAIAYSYFIHRELERRRG